MKLIQLREMSALHTRTNLALVGPQGVGKTNLAIAYARRCCEAGYKSYYLKASELDQKLKDARKYARESSLSQAL